MVGQRISRLSRKRRSGSFAGATILEWNACEVASGIDWKPLASKAAMASLTGAVSPAITVIFGEFLFAAITYPSMELMMASTSG